jgi:hypothetical protein
LDNNGKFQAVPPDIGGKYFSKLLKGFWLKPDWLWQDPLPDVEDIILEIDGENYVRRQLEKFKQKGFNDLC